MKQSYSTRISIGILGLCLAMTASPTMSSDDHDDDRVPVTKGRIARLSAAWWQWSLSIPAEGHPLSFNDASESAKYCGVGQHGDVWFLGGTFDGSPATRHCTVPAGVPIFMPILNAECSTIEGDGTTERELRACAEGLIDHVTVVEAAVDGRPLRRVDRSRVHSKLFNFTLPEGDLLGLFGSEPNPSASVADGYWVYVPPLPEGDHTIEVHGVAPFPEFGFTFEQDTAYSLTVVAP